MLTSQRVAWLARNVSVYWERVKQYVFLHIRPRSWMAQQKSRWMQRIVSETLMRSNQSIARQLVLLFSIAGSGLLVPSAEAEEKPPAEKQVVKHRVTGLFMPEREADLAEVIQKIPHVELVSVDYPNAEATFRYHEKEAFGQGKPEQIIERFNNLVRMHSHSTFGIVPLRTTPLDKLQTVNISVVGLDCKACSLAIYEIVIKIDGVELATASFKSGKVTAVIQSEKTSQAAIEETLKKRGVTLAEPTK